jgi:hypothetical protein
LAKKLYYVSCALKNTEAYGCCYADNKYIVYDLRGIGLDLNSLCLHILNKVLFMAEKNSDVVCDNSFEFILYVIKKDLVKSWGLARWRTSRGSEVRDKELWLSISGLIKEKRVRVMVPRKGKEPEQLLKAKEVLLSKLNILN